MDTEGETKCEGCHKKFKQLNIHYSRSTTCPLATKYIPPCTDPDRHNVPKQHPISISIFGEHPSSTPPRLWSSDYDDIAKARDESPDIIETMVSVFLAATLENPAQFELRGIGQESAAFIIFIANEVERCLALSSSTASSSSSSSSHSPKIYDRATVTTCRMPGTDGPNMLITDDFSTYGARNKTRKQVDWNISAQLTINLSSLPDDGLGGTVEGKEPYKISENNRKPWSSAFFGVVGSPQLPPNATSRAHKLSVSIALRLANQCGKSLLRYPALQQLLKNAINSEANINYYKSNDGNSIYDVLGERAIMLRLSKNLPGGNACPTMTNLTNSGMYGAPMYRSNFRCVCECQMIDVEALFDGSGNIVSKITHPFGGESDEVSIDRQENTISVYFETSPMKISVEAINDAIKSVRELRPDQWAVTYYLMYGPCDDQTSFDGNELTKKLLGNRLYNVHRKHPERSGISSIPESEFDQNDIVAMKTCDTLIAKEICKAHTMSPSADPLEVNNHIRSKLAQFFNFLEKVDKLSDIAPDEAAAFNLIRFDFMKILLEVERLIIDTATLGNQPESPKEQKIADEPKFSPPTGNPSWPRSFMKFRGDTGACCNTLCPKSKKGKWPKMSQGFYDDFNGCFYCQECFGPPLTHSETTDDAPPVRTNKISSEVAKAAEGGVIIERITQATE